MTKKPGPRGHRCKDCQYTRTGDWLYCSAYGVALGQQQRHYVGDEHGGFEMPGPELGLSVGQPGEHSPAPWRWSEEDLPGDLVAADGSHVIHSYAYEVKNPRDRALIAAAPELLAALIGVMDQWGWCTCKDCPTCKAERLIARIEGK